MTATKSKAKTTANPVEDAVVAGRETVEQAVKMGAEAATKGYEQAFAVTKEQMDKASEFAFQGYDELSDVNKGAVDAFVAASGAMSKGVEVLSKEVFAYTKGSMDQSMAITTKLMTVKSFKEFTDIQSDYAKSSFDGALAETVKLQELSAKIANDAFAPLNAYWTTAVSKTFKPIAA